MFSLGLMVVRLALTFLSFAGMSACITHDWIAKAASGRVVDAGSGRPIAEVAIYRVLEDKSIFVGATPLIPNPS